jgi:FMN-dependent NADH-azoreductase
MTTRILEISASPRDEESISRLLTRDLLKALEDRHGDVTLTRRDVAKGLPFVDADWVVATNTPEEDRSDAQRRTLAFSDELVGELIAADIVVVGAPIHNFSVPATLKAWIDLVARVRLTFRYTENGPVGLLEGKRAYVLTPSGGVPVGSAVDFATPYLRHALGFIGISDVEIIGAQGADRGNDQALDDARARIAEIVHLETQAA